MSLTRGNSQKRNRSAGSCGGRIVRPSRRVPRRLISRPQGRKSARPEISWPHDTKRSAMKRPALAGPNSCPRVNLYGRFSPASRLEARWSRSFPQGDRSGQNIPRIGKRLGRQEGRFGRGTCHNLLPVNALSCRGVIQRYVMCNYLFFPSTEGKNARRVSFGG